MNDSARTLALLTRQWYELKAWSEYLGAAMAIFTLLLLLLVRRTSWSPATGLLVCLWMTSAVGTVTARLLRGVVRRRMEAIRAAIRAGTVEGYLRS